MATHKAWTPELEQALSAPFPDELIQEKRKGGSSISFVAWHHYTRRLNALVGSGWSMGEPIMRDVAGKLVVALPVTILGTTRVNFGSEDEGKDDYGDAATNAWAQAFKRTCALFGMGLDMYDKDGRAAAANRRQQTEPPSDAQMGQIRALLGSERFTEDERNAVARSLLERPTSANAGRIVGKLEKQVAERGSSATTTEAAPGSLLPEDAGRGQQRQPNAQAR